MSKKIQIVGLDIPQSDWNQTDETKLDYIKNKPETVTTEQVREIISESGSSTAGMSYQAIDPSIDYSASRWLYYAKSDNVHVLIPEPTRDPESEKAVTVSQDGMVWKTYTLPEGGYRCGLAYGNGKFLLVSSNSSTAYISENGIDWSSVTLPYSVYDSNTSIYSYKLHPNNVIFYKNCFYVACQQSSQGIIIKSSDGINWTSIGYPHTEAIDTLIISCADDLCYISQYNNNTGKCQTFKLLEDDTFTNLGLYNLYRLVGKCDNKYYAVLYSPGEGFGDLRSSTDGTGWSSVDETWLDSLYDINVIMNDSTIITWGSGESWDYGAIDFTYIYTDGTWNSLDNLDFSLSTVLWNGVEFVAINDMIVRTSPDGLTWQQGGKQWITQAGEDITNEVKTFLASDALAYYHTDTAYEKTSWAIGKLTHGSVAREDGTTSNRFVAIYTGCEENYDYEYDEETGEETEIITYSYPQIAAYSDDGLTWHQTPLPVEGYWSDVCYTGEAFIAVAKGSQTLIYSTDGIAWNSMELPILADWTSLARTRNGIIIVSNGNKVLWGEGNIANGFTWTETTLESDDGSKLNLSRICWAVDQGFGIAVGGSKSVIFNSNRQYAIHDLPATDFIDITMITPEPDEDWYFEFYAVTVNGELATTANAYDRGYDYSEELPDVSWSLFNTEFPVTSYYNLVRLIIGNGDNGDGTYQNYLIFNRSYCYNGSDLVEWYDPEYWEYVYVTNVAADYYDGKIIVYGTNSGSGHTAICVSTDGGLTWKYSYSDLIQKGESVSEGVASAVWGHIAPQVDKKIPAIPDHLDIGSSVGTRDQGVYNSNLDRIVVQTDDYVRYSDDNGKTWIEFDGGTKGTVCGAIGNVFVFKDYDVTTTEEEVWIEDEFSDGGGYYDIEEVTTINRVKIFVHTLVSYQEWIECLFKDSEGNTVDLPKQYYHCISGAYEGKDRLILIGDDNTTAAYSEDGVTWIVTTTNFSEIHDNSADIVYGNGIFLSSCNKSSSEKVPVAKSLDGINWTISEVLFEETPPSGSVFVGGSALFSIIYGNGRFIGEYAIGYINPEDPDDPGSSLNGMATSTDGTTWEVHPSVDLNPNVIVVGNRFLTYTYDGAYYSTDGINWTYDSTSPKGDYIWDPVIPGDCNVYQIAPNLVYLEFIPYDSYGRPSQSYYTDGYTWTSAEYGTRVLVKGEENVTAQVSSAILTNIMNTYRKIIAPEDWTEDGAIVQFSKTQVTPESIVIVSADINSMTAYEDAGIRCVKQDYGALTFICNTIPSSAVNVNIMIIQAPVDKYIPYIEDPRGEGEV